MKCLVLVSLATEKSHFYLVITRFVSNLERIIQHHEVYEFKIFLGLLREAAEFAKFEVPFLGNISGRFS